MESKRSESIMNLAAALAIAQGQIKTASKDAKGNYSNYSTLDAIWDACRQPLAENGLSVIQIPTTGEGLSLETLLLHSSGEWVSGVLSLTVATGRMNEHQAFGSALTYARRYALSAMVGIASGDDDDGEAGGKLSERSTSQAKRPDNTSGNGDMSLAKLLGLLKKVEVSGMTTFYQGPDDIMACRAKGSPLPAADDVEGWRNLFVAARDYAIDRINEAIEGGKISPDQMPIPRAAAVKAAQVEIEAEETAQMAKMSGQIEAEETDEAPF